jgi:hypothetical protein
VTGQIQKERKSRKYRQTERTGIMRIDQKSTCSIRAVSPDSVYFWRRMPDRITMANVVYVIIMNMSRKVAYATSGIASVIRQWMNTATINIDAFSPSRAGAFITSDVRDTIRRRSTGRKNFRTVDVISLSIS